MAAESPLWNAIKAAHRRWSPDTAHLLPDTMDWRPAPALSGNPGATGGPSAAPPATAAQRPESRLIGPSADDEAMEQEERAAIIEFDGGLDRQTADALAAARPRPPPVSA